MSVRMSISTRGIHYSLIYLIEDPPIALGRSMLARHFLPHESSPLQRGRRLQQALYGAIGALRPGGLPEHTPQWLPYRIYAGEYLEGRHWSEVRRELAISRAAYVRAKQVGRAGVLALLPELLKATPTPEQHLHAVVERFSAAFGGGGRSPDIAAATGDLLNALHTTAQHAVTDVVAFLLARLDEIEQRVSALEGPRERAVGDD